MKRIIDNAAKCFVHFKSGSITLRNELPENAHDCARLIRLYTQAAKEAPDSMITAVVSGDAGDSMQGFTAWEVIHHRTNTVDGANSYTLGVLLFVMLFRRFPKSEETTLHRHIDYNTASFELSDGFAEEADDFLRHSMCISRVCRFDASSLSLIAERMVLLSDKNQIHKDQQAL